MTTSLINTSSRLNTLIRATRATVVAGALCLGAAPAAFAEADLSQVPAGAYSVDPTHAYIQFQYNHLGLSNPILTFDEFTIDMNLDNADPAKTSVAVGITVDSVQTGSEIWHDHLTGEKWLDSSSNPEITFKSTSVEGSGSSFKVTGDLTVKGQTKPVTLDVTINAATNHPMSKKPVIGISAEGQLLRSDWGLGKNAPFVSDEITLKIEAEMLQG